MMYRLFPKNAKGNIFCCNWCKLNAKNKHPLNTQSDEQDVLYKCERHLFTLHTDKLSRIFRQVQYQLVFKRFFVEKYFHFYRSIMIILFQYGFV